MKRSGFYNDSRLVSSNGGLRKGKRESLLFTRQILICSAAFKKAAELIKDIFGDKIAVYRLRGNDGKQQLTFRNVKLRDKQNKSTARVTESINDHGWFVCGNSPAGKYYIRFTGHNLNGSDHSLRIAITDDKSFATSSASGISSVITQNDLMDDLIPVDLPFILFDKGLSTLAKVSSKLSIMAEFVGSQRKTSL